jgi:hypothetical protein
VPRWYHTLPSMVRLCAHYWAKKLGSAETVHSVPFPSCLMSRRGKAASIHCLKKRWEGWRCIRAWHGHFFRRRQQRPAVRRPLCAVLRDRHGSALLDKKRSGMGCGGGCSLGISRRPGISSTVCACFSCSRRHGFCAGRLD